MKGTEYRSTSSVHYIFRQHVFTLSVNLNLVAYGTLNMVLEVIMVDKRPSSKQRISLEFQTQTGKYSGQQNSSSPGILIPAPRRQPPEYRHQEALLPQRNIKGNVTLQHNNNSLQGNVISRIKKCRDANKSTKESRLYTSSSMTKKASDVSKVGAQCTDTLELPMLPNAQRRVSGTSSQLTLRSRVPSSIVQMRSTSCPSFAASQDGKDRTVSYHRKTRSLSLEPPSANTNLTPTPGGSQEPSLQDPNDVSHPAPLVTDKEFPNIAENPEESTEVEESKQLNIPGPPMHVMSMARKRLHKVAHSANPAKYQHDWRTGDEKIFESYQDLFSTEGRRYLNVSDMEPELAEQVLSQQEAANDHYASQDRCIKWLDTLPFYGTAFGVNYSVEAGFDDESETKTTDVAHVNNVSEHATDESWHVS